MTSADLRELARLHGIQLTYDDAAGKKRTASRESLEAGLRALLPEGVKLEKALAQTRAKAAARVIEPVIVAWGRSKARFPLAEDSTYQLTLESGDKREGKLIPKRGVATLDRELPFGYHKVRINKKHEAMLFVAPSRAPEPRTKSWGAFAPVYAIHTARTWGAGDLGDLTALQQWIRSLGGDVMATLPLNAIFAEQDPSPYSPISRLFWNEMYLDVSKLPEYRGETLEPLPMTDRIDYRQVVNAKRKLLLQLSKRFFERPDDGFAEFAQKTNDYALFRARMESTAGSWRDWAEEDSFGFDSARYHLYGQYRMTQQLREIKGLYLDFPLGVHPNGYDAWRFDEHFARNAAVGAPPDLIFTKGQNWGFPPLHPESSREHHHAYFRECIRRQLEYASMLRIDHVMGLHRLFWIPEGMEAQDGVYVRYPEDELYAVLTIEANRANAVIVGEDLGTVPQYVPKMMEQRGVQRMYVVQYENRAGKPPADSVASVNTHDMPTFSSFWNGKDIGQRVEEGLLDEAGAEIERAQRERTRRDLVKVLLPKAVSETRTVLESLLRFLGRSDAKIVLVNLEDLWLEEKPQNVPGVPERSWRQRLRPSLEEMQNDETVTRTLRAVDDARKMNGNEK